MELKTTGMRRLNELIELILNKPTDATAILIESPKVTLNVPIGDKDVMCMTVLQLINDEYGGATVGEVNEMLLDTIWWLATFMIAFPPNLATEPENE